MHSERRTGHRHIDGIYMQLMYPTVYALANIMKRENISDLDLLTFVGTRSGD